MKTTIIVKKSGELRKYMRELMSKKGNITVGNSRICINIEV